MISRGCLACSSAHVWRSVLRCAGAHTSVLGVRGSRPSETHARSAARRSVHSSRTAAHATAGHSSSAAKRSVALLPGNGVGPEIADAVVHVFDVAGAPIEWDWVNEYALPGPDGGDHIIRDNALETIKRHGIALKGPFGTPDGIGHTALHLQLRKRLNLFANVRPARSVRGCKTVYDGVDIVVIRENTEGEYSGLEHEVVEGVVTNLKVITRGASERIAKFAMEYAVQNNRRLVTACHKANVMKLSDGLFLQCCRDAAKAYDGRVQFEEMDMDRVVLQLASRPERFDVLVLPNLYGDIASDMAAGLIGGLGLTPSGNIGHNVAVFESIHGTAPDIAGRDKANPTALLLSGVLMLRHMDLRDVAQRIEDAVLSVLASRKYHTEDLGGTAKCSEFTEAVCDHLRQSSTDGA